MSSAPFARPFADPGRVGIRRIVVDARRLGLALAWCVAALFLANAATQALFLLGGYPYQLGLRPLFNLNREANLPSFYSGALIGLNAILIGGVGIDRWRTRAPAWRGWCVLALVFFYLAIDELCALHEHIGAFMRETYALPGGLLYFAWVLPGAAFALFVLLLSQGFLRSLDRETRRTALLAGMVFALGAIGVEMISGWRWELVAHNSDDALYIVLFTIEETLELCGMSLMAFAMARCWQASLGPVVIDFAPAKQFTRVGVRPVRAKTATGAG